MFDKLDFISDKYDELSAKVSDPEIIANQALWQKYAKEMGEMEPIVKKYQEYKKIKGDIKGAKEMLDEGGMDEEARTRLTQYWGAMIQRGADTFWEVYDPNDELASPYNFYPINSYCHAWSCTPVYFINKYPEIFQR